MRLFRFLQPNWRSFTVIIVLLLLPSTKLQVLSTVDSSFLSTVPFIFFSVPLSLCIVFSPQLPAQATHSSATATCVLTTPWCAMGFRTVSTHGMKTTAKVIILFLPTSPKWVDYSWSGFILACFEVSTSISVHIISVTFLSFLIFSSLHPPEKRSKGLFHQITKTHGTVIGVSSGIVLVLLIISILVQMKQPRKKVNHSLCLTFCQRRRDTELKWWWDSRLDGGTCSSADREDWFYSMTVHVRSKMFCFGMIFFLVEPLYINLSQLFQLFYGSLSFLLSLVHFAYYPVITK